MLILIRLCCLEFPPQSSFQYSTSTIIRRELLLSSTFIARLATPESSAKLLRSSFITQKYEYTRLGLLRHERAALLISQGSDTLAMGGGKDELRGDPAWNNLSAYIISLRDRVRLVSWEAPLLGCLCGHLYGVTPDGVVAITRVITHSTRVMTHLTRVIAHLTKE
jgi:hypothetical protein